MQAGQYPNTPLVSEVKRVEYRAPSTAVSIPVETMLAEVLTSLVPEDILQFSKPVQAWWLDYQETNKSRQAIAKATKLVEELTTELSAAQERLNMLRALS